MTSLGQKIKDGGKRDAVHVPIMPVIIDDDGISPGDRVNFAPGSKELVLGVVSDKGIGIIDPFLPRDIGVRIGDKVWMLLNPGTITDLRHEWSHEDIDVVNETITAEKITITKKKI